MPSLCYSASFSEDRSRLLPVVRNQECLRNQECRNRRVEEAEGNDDKDWWGTKASGYISSLLIEQPNTFSEQEGLPTSFVDANTHTQYILHAGLFVQKNGAATVDDSARLLQPFRLCFFPLHFVQTRYADVFEDVLDIWLCRQTTMPVPFDSNKPSFSIACLRKLRVGTFQANLPCHPYPFVLQSVRQEQVTKKQPRSADNSTSQCLSS